MVPRRSFLKGTAAAFAAALLHNLAVTRALAEAGSRQKPNIVLILSDDVGYGDLGCYGAKLPRTPHIDGLAQCGRRFTDGHSDASVCTPSRYAILSGMYAWRRADARILPGDAALLFADHQTTLPSLLKEAGYKTGCVGKWHMGLGRGEIDWNGVIAPGPREVGFDYSFIIPATADRVPCVYVEDGRVVGLDKKDPIRVDYKKLVGDDPTGHDEPYLLKMKLSEGHDGTIVDGVGRIGFMTGGNNARWVDEKMAATLAEKATAFIDTSYEKPFFLYFATSDIHVPRMPNDHFAGRSACGVRCDVIEQLDWTVGQVLAALEKHKLMENTLILFSSDNGPVVDDGYADGSVENLHGHTPSGTLRGGKYSLYEGGTRVPMIAYSNTLCCCSTWYQLRLAKFHRLYRNFQCLGDFLVPVAIGNQLQHFPLPLRQGTGRAARPPGASRHPAFQCRSHVGLSFQNPLDGGAQLFHRGRLQHVPRSAGVEDLPEVYWAGMHAEEQKFGLRVCLLDLSCGVDPIQQGHGNVQNNKIRLQPPGCLHQGPAVAHLPH